MSRLFKTISRIVLIQLCAGLFNIEKANNCRYHHRFKLGGRVLLRLHVGTTALAIPAIASMPVAVVFLLEEQDSRYAYVRGIPTSTHG